MCVCVCVCVCVRGKLDGSKRPGPQDRRISQLKGGGHIAHLLDSCAIHGARSWLNTVPLNKKCCQVVARIPVLVF